MKKEGLFILGIFIVVFMVSGVSAIQKIKEFGAIDKIYLDFNESSISLDSPFYYILYGNSLNLTINISAVYHSGIYFPSGLIEFSYKGERFSREISYSTFISLIGGEGDNRYAGDFLSYIDFELLNNTRGQIQSSRVEEFFLSKNNNIADVKIYFLIIEDNDLVSTEFHYKNGTISNENIKYYYIVDGIYDDRTQKIFALESWKQTITGTITNILNSITNITTKADNHESRITSLEKKQQNQTNISNYFKYLSSSDRKNIVCGYAKDNHLIQLIDLGWNCTITYRQSTSGERASCRCKKV